MDTLPGESRAARYFGEVQRLTRAAGSASRRIERDYEIAGLPVRLRFAGPAMEALAAPALAHLATPLRPAAEGLVVDLWDAASAGVALPESPCGRDDVLPRGDMLGFNDRRFKMAYHSYGRLLSVLDLERGRAIVCAADAAAIPYFERACPLRPVIAWWLRQHGVQLLHGAAVGSAGAAVMLVGKSGAGKSTTALRCMLAGLDYLGDDLCAVNGGAAPVVHCVYSSAKTQRRDGVALGRLADAVANPADPDTEKAIYFLHPHWRPRIARARPLRAILLPDHRARGPIGFAPASPAEVLVAIAPTTATLLPDFGGELLAALAPLVRALPCYRFTLGDDPAAIPGAIAGLIARAAEAPARAGAA